ncbi:hypothetical protein EVAR_98338_1 [Eumeta japonica]|uniref:Uncharacterized protein n=1 Tax=Eumeta variegata TaxID=151549 RepID=A0A4C1X9F2_EUMVA|nr:hypothetical protein EVAR_98338_1 [Eumeta japonica]
MNAPRDPEPSHVVGVIKHLCRLCNSSNGWHVRTALTTCISNKGISGVKTLAGAGAGRAGRALGGAGGGGRRAVD